MSRENRITTEQTGMTRCTSPPTSVRFSGARPAVPDGDECAGRAAAPPATPSRSAPPPGRCRRWWWLMNTDDVVNQFHGAEYQRRAGQQRREVTQPGSHLVIHGNQAPRRATQRQRRTPQPGDQRAENPRKLKPSAKSSSITGSGCAQRRNTADSARWRWSPPSPPRWRSP